MGRKLIITPEIIADVTDKIIYGKGTVKSCAKELGVGYDTMKKRLPIEEIRNKRKMMIAEHYLTHQLHETAAVFGCSTWYVYESNQYRHSLIDAERQSMLLLQEQSAAEKANLAKIIDKEERIAIARDIHLRVKKNVEEARLRRKREADRIHNHPNHKKQIV